MSETFLLAHAERMPARVSVVHFSGAHGPSMGDRRMLRAYRVRKLLCRVFPDSAKWESRLRTRAFRTAIRRSRAQAVLAEFGKSGVAVMHACRAEGVPLIVHFHGYDASIKSVLAEYADAYRELFGIAAAICAPSRPMLDRLRSLGAPLDRLAWTPCGVDCTRFKPARAEANDPIFVAVGRFVPKKAPHITLRAFAAIHRQYPAARMIMVGDGPLLGPCRDLARALGVDGAVEFLGSVKHQRVPELMLTARTFVQHSVVAPDGDREGTPVSIAEAGASALPVVATRHEGIPDIVLDGVTGFLVDEGDVDGMADRMLQLAVNRQCAGWLGRAARVRVEREFSLERCIDRLWSVIATSIPGTHLTN